jgi:2-amino-4-hydroxy-6-hydroxymethyldihydropteridine diphosphokinase
MSISKISDTVPHVVEAYITIGSNIEPEKNLILTVGLLRQYGIVTAISSVYETTPEGYVDQDDFLNMAVAIKTSYPIEDFKRIALDSIEQELHRVRDPQNVNAPRTIDLDIALWGRQVLDYGEKPWHIPDINITRYAFVAIPLAEIAPQFVHPESGQTLADIAARFEVNFPLRRDVVFV